MAGANPKTPKELKIFEYDPSLRAVEGDVKARTERYLNRKKELLGTNKKLSSCGVLSGIICCIALLACEDDICFSARVI